jgi:hypothetical protein
VDATTGIITTVAGNGTQVYNGGANGGDGKPATLAAIWNPTGVALDIAGNIYIAEGGASAIRRVDVTTGVISTVAGTGARATGAAGGLAKDTALNMPNDVLVSSTGRIVIPDSSNHVLRVLNCSGPPPAFSAPPTPGVVSGRLQHEM